MSDRLYEDETVEVYNPRNGYMEDVMADQILYEQVGNDEIIGKAKKAEELLHSAGWKLVKADLDAAIESCSEGLLESIDPAQIARYQSAIKVYKSIEGFINRYILEGKLAMDNSQE
jgi:spermidine/putrescine-binding protein